MSELTAGPSGHLVIGGCDALELASRFGTPLHVLDEQRIRDACRAFTHAASAHFGPSARVLYASKALSTTAVLRIAASEGLGADVVSGGELYTALRAGLDPGDIVFHGNNKTPAELREALAAGIGRIAVDNSAELDRLSSIAAGMGVTADVQFRIKPGVSAHTHEYVRTGSIDSKFGFALETGEAEREMIRAMGLPGIRVRGVHCHIGSQIFGSESFVEAARIMTGFLADFAVHTGVRLEELNLGGGYGIRYTASDTPSEPDAILAPVADAVRAVCADRAFPFPDVLIEPGRAIVATAGTTLYTVGSVKTIPGIRTYVAVDGGMYENPRYALYHAAYELVRADDPHAAREYPVTIAGKCCETGDLIQENVPMPPLREGDVVAVLATGAYHYSMAGNYNRNPRPAVVLCRDGSAMEIVRRETYEDLVRNDLIPEGL